MRIPGNPLRSARPLRILMRNRRDAFSHPGGDTVVMERLRDGLQGLGHAVAFDLDAAADAGAFDLVHLFNLTLPGLIGPMARDALDKGVPFLIHALQEDWPRFLNQALATAVVLEKYVAAGQPRERLESTLAMLRECPAAEMPFCAEAARAAAILCTGAEEVATVRRDYPAARAPVIPLATGSHPAADAPGADFRSAMGGEDFVLCVGRLEPRKNQLMLLAALEDSDLTVVFADGGFAYAPEYAEACRKFRRRGRTVFTGRLPLPALVSAYRSARVCCLPSWYELPGLATLEAASWSRQVVASPYGTIADYLGDACLYAAPDDPDGLGARIREAWDRPAGPALRERAAAFTWARTAAETEKIYREILAMRI
ncbi:MAG TPA: glycosyltransferase family 4 protein [Fibrobacteria bacterium]|nr:glycosyltransferase family 4 protein [Fibrobacteria bacterium]